MPPPNILDWYEAVDDNADKYENTPLTVLGKLEPLPQRLPSPVKANKRKRINSDGKAMTTATSKDSTQINSELDNSATTPQFIALTNEPLPEIVDDVELATPQNKPSGNIPWLLNTYPTDQPLPENLVGKKVRFNQAESKDDQQNVNPEPVHIEIHANNASHSNLQDGDRDFLKISEDAHPFFKRSRGCLSAASRADCRASHLEELVEREVPLPWALRLEPIPAYLMQITPQLIRIQKRNAIALQREAAKFLRRSCTHLTTQGTLNWNIVAKFYGNDDEGLSQAKQKMDTLVARDFTREQDKLEDRKNDIFDHPVTNEAITNNLKIRGYNNPNRPPRERSPVRVNPPRQNIPNARDEPDRQDNRNNRPMMPQNNQRPQARAKRRRSNSRSRSRSPSRNRGGAQYNRYDQRPNYRGGPRGRARGNNRYRGYQDRPQQYNQGQNNLPDPDQLGAIIRQVVEQFNQPPPPPPQNRGRDYRR